MFNQNTCIMKRLVVLMFLMVVGTIGLFAQIEPPGDIIEWVGALPLYLGSWEGVAISFPFLVAFVLGVTNQVDAKKVVKYLITGVVGIILLLLAFFLDFGYLHGAYWWWVPVNFVGLILSEILAYTLIGNLLDAFAEKVNPWKPSQ